MHFLIGVWVGVWVFIRCSSVAGGIGPAICGGLLHEEVQGFSVRVGRGAQPTECLVRRMASGGGNHLTVACKEQREIRNAFAKVRSSGARSRAPTI
jgi:hypothetical protein